MAAKLILPCWSRRCWRSAAPAPQKERPRRKEPSTGATSPPAGPPSLPTLRSPFPARPPVPLPCPSLPTLRPPGWDTRRAPPHPARERPAGCRGHRRDADLTGSSGIRRWEMRRAARCFRAGCGAPGRATSRQRRHRPAPGPVNPLRAGETAGSAAFRGRGRDAGAVAGMPGPGGCSRSAGSAGLRDSAGERLPRARAFGRTLSQR